MSYQVKHPFWLKDMIVPATPFTRWLCSIDPVPNNTAPPATLADCSDSRYVPCSLDANLNNHYNLHEFFFCQLYVT